MPTRYGPGGGRRARICHRCRRFLGLLAGSIRLRGGLYFCGDQTDCRAEAVRRILAARQEMRPPGPEDGS